MAGCASGRPLRIAGCSGSASDRRHAMHSFASNYPKDRVDVIVGDWMSEGNMATKAWAKTSSTGIGYESTFIESLVPALPFLAKYGIKVISNAGTADTKKLYEEVQKIVKEQGLNLKLAWISGDEVLPQVLAAKEKGQLLENIYTGETIDKWGFKPFSAQAYLGGFGIAAALAKGADIVICGRVSDASPVIGAAVWWHDWKRANLHLLANAFVAGHLIECSTYVTGGNSNVFKELEGQGWDDIGYPIAEISEMGEVVITKQKGTNGTVTIDTVTGQLLYEIQGPWYFNSDVTALLSGITFEQRAHNRVAVHGVKGDLPPPTTKVGITASGGYQAEVHWFLVGLDIEAKARMMEAQVRKVMASRVNKLRSLDFQTHGTAGSNPKNQRSATVDFRIIAQAWNEEDLAPQQFLRPCLDVMMQAAPGATVQLDFRQGFPKQIFEYYVALMPQSELKHEAHLDTGESLAISHPTRTKTWPKQQPSEHQTAHVWEPITWGEREWAPLGSIVRARSGDKGSDCNVGFWVRHLDEWEWLSSLLSVSEMKRLLGEDYNGKQIDRFELPGARAVHFLLHDHLDRGVNATTSYDLLGKNCAEYLRARHVEIPKRFLYRKRL